MNIKQLEILKTEHKKASDEWEKFCFDPGALTAKAQRALHKRNSLMDEILLYNLCNS